MTSSFVEDSYDRFRTIRSTLGKPDFEAPGVMLYQVDSLTTMPLLIAQLMDLTVTSPPYNNRILVILGDLISSVNFWKLIAK